MLPLVLGIGGTHLTVDEATFFKSADPWGYVLFARNCAAPDQIRNLVSDTRSLVGREAPFFIDQEGGRVQRLRGADWHDRPAASAFADLYRYDPAKACRAVHINARLMAHDLAELGITGNFAPVLDLSSPETHPSIADRTFGDEVEAVAKLGRQMCEAQLDQGILPVLKHSPGQGRAKADSHLEAPVVTADLESLEATDFEPFRQLKDMPAAMVAHVIYSAIDPNNPATISDRVIGQVIRGEIGFDGLLFSDDIAMAALSGAMEDRAVKCLRAGCDMALFCASNLAEMDRIASKVGAIGPDSARRAAIALSRLTKPQFLDDEELTAELATLLNPQA